MTSITDATRTNFDPSLYAAALNVSVEGQPSLQVQDDEAARMIQPEQAPAIEPRVEPVIAVPENNRQQRVERILIKACVGILVLGMIGLLFAVGKLINDGKL